MMNQSTANGYWHVAPPPQINEQHDEDNRESSVAVQRYHTQNLQVRLRHRTISPILEHESDELENFNEGIAGFISKLYLALQAPDDGNKYARWTKANGKDMFVIDCIPKFTDTVLPKLFKHCKFASFVRQLNIYGFQRDTDARKYKEPKDRESCRWYHANFRPGRRDLFHLIRRKTSVCNKRRRRSSQLVKAEALDTETIIPVGSDSENDDYYENMQRSSGIEDKRRLQEVTKRPMVLNSPLASMHQQQQQANLNVNLSSRKHAMVLHCDDNNTLYLKQQILELKQMFQSMEKTFAHEIARAQEQIHTQKQQLDMLQSVVESLRQTPGRLRRLLFSLGNSPSRGNNNEVATSSALPPYLGDLNVDGSPKLVETNSHSPLEQTIYDERQHRNTMTNNALVQFQKYSQVTHEPDTPPPPPVTSAAGQQVSGMAVPQAPQGDSGNVSIGLSPQRHHFGYSNFGQVPQSSDDWSVFSSAAGGDPPMPKYTTLHYHQQQAGPAQAGFPSERRPFAPDYGIMSQNNIS